MTSTRRGVDDAGGRRRVEESAVLVDGPWTHRDVSANGIRLPVAEVGTGHLAWTLAALHTSLVRRIAVLSMPHPLRWPAALRSAAQRRATSYVLRFQLPWHPERWIVANDASNIADLLHDWGGRGFPDEET